MEEAFTADRFVIGIMSRFVHPVVSFVVCGRRVSVFCAGLLACILSAQPNPNDQLTIWAITNEARTQLNPGAVLDSSHLESFFSQWEKVGVNLSGNRARALRDFDYAKALYGQQTLLNLLAEYRSTHAPHRELRVRFFTWDDYFEKLKQISDDESAPDVVQVPSTWCSSLAD